MYLPQLLIGLLLMLNAGVSIGAQSSHADRPNLIVIVVDDMRWDEFATAGHPYLNTPNIDRLAAEGAMFNSAYAVTPLCSPNRASILTGQYASRHGVVDNLARDLSSHRLPLFAAALQRGGYETAHVGKWHMGNDPTPRPGYDYWVSYAGQGCSVNPMLYEDGQSNIVEGYMTDILTDRAVAFIQRSREMPFFLYLGHKAVHPEVKQLNDSSIDIAYGSRYVPAPRHQGTYRDKVFPRRGNTGPDVDELSSKPVLSAVLNEKSSSQMETKWGKLLDPGTSEKTIRDRSEMLLAVDESLGRILEQLESSGELDNTAIVFTSDNGYFYGEHGLSIERRLPYEESVRVPLLMRYPPLIKSGARVDEFALSIDIAPTMLDLAGVAVGEQVQGKSLVGLLGNPSTTWRDSFLIEYVSYEKPMPWLVDTSYKAVRKNQYKYIHWVQQPQSNELYDLDADPYELNNLYHDDKKSSLVAALKVELGGLLATANGL